LTAIKHDWVIKRKREREKAREGARETEGERGREIEDTDAVTVTVTVRGISIDFIIKTKPNIFAASRLIYYRTKRFI